VRHWATGGGERLRAVGISGAQWRSSVALSEMEASGEGDSPPLARIVGDCTAAESAASDTDPHIGRGPPEAAFLPHVWRGSTPAASLFCCRGGHCNSTRTQQPDPTRLLSSTGCDATQRQSCRRRYSTLRESIRLLEALTAKTPPSEHVGGRGSAAEASPGHLFPPSRPGSRGGRAGWRVATNSWRRCKQRWRNPRWGVWCTRYSK